TALTAPIATTDSLTIDGKTIAFSNSGGNVIAATGATLDLTNATVGDLLTAIDTITGTATPSTLGATQLTLSTGTAQNLVIGGTAGTLTKLGLTAATTPRGGGTYALSGQTLDIAATGNGTATAITFGTGAGQVSTLNQLNAALATNNLQASIDSAGAITITTLNNAAASTIGAITGTATPFASLTAAAPVVDPNSQSTRNSLVAQYNQVLAQIDTTSQDSSFNGINLSNLTAGIDFLDSNSANAVLAQLNQASTTLRTAASSLGSNLSIVEIRQDFNKNLINVLQTGASNLTVADPNEEAANSQALSTRQSIAVSALALANQSQQSVLQLLR